jgi:predicted GTPase
MTEDAKLPFEPEQIAALKRAILEAFHQAPPTIGVIGASGVGKSSTINAMFKTDLRVSHVVACTKEFLATDLGTEIREGEAKGESVALRIVDAPGLGEDIQRDVDYLEMYSEHLPKCDVILWVMAARNRAIALDQRYLRLFEPYHGKIVFGVNQVDLVEPMNWSGKINLPSDEQLRNIDLIVNDRRARLESVMTAPVVVAPYSARRRYNLQELFTLLIEHCTSERSWMFGALKAFHPDDFIPAAFRDEVLQAVAEEGEGGRPRSTPFPFSGIIRRIRPPWS